MNPLGPSWDWAMTKGEVQTGLSVLRDRFRRILDSGAAQVLESARMRVEETKREHDKRTRQGRIEYPVTPWGYEVSPQMPLRFRTTKVDGLSLCVDVIARAEWLDSDAEPQHHELAVRVWCLDDHVVYRPDWDSPCIKDRTKPQRGRVMLRCHFDRANPGQPGPKHHFQVGGKAHEEECCWLHPTISVPRLAHPPMDLVLACEMIAANFFPEEYKTIRSDPTWKGVLNRSQKGLLAPYYERCRAVLSDGSQSLLDELWCT